ncbi:MAG: hypothetical protein Kow0080_29890 [Candidatus Promineifilaceae bacterium]
MCNEKINTLIGKTPLHNLTSTTAGGFVQRMGEAFYHIAHYDQMPPFFMSLVSSADHWLFIASTGGLTAGRINANSALFPYETEDKITAHSDLTGGKTIVRVTRNGRTQLWEPFSSRYNGLYRVERHLYKSACGSKLLFEEINHDLQLAFRYSWRMGDHFGFCKSGWLVNNGEPCQIDLLDGLQNILPFGASVQLQTTMSSLLHAYKRSELDPETGLGIFALSATLTDRAEPSESLMATVAWQVGLDNPVYLLSTAQVDGFRHGRFPTPEHDICGQPGAYLAASIFTLAANETKQWHVTADVNYDHTAVTRLRRFLRQESAAITAAVEADIAQNTANLMRFVAAADGLQHSAQQETAVHHFANVLFNIMRGGIFADGYQVERNDFLDFVRTRNRPVLARHANWFHNLPESIAIHDLYALADENGDPNVIRLSHEYLPLTFSRRHGDPSRPWNWFSINLKNADGSPRLDYQGNWRDIFQNWEPLALAYPDFAEGMIAKFLNATTADGYNPYRVTRDGIEWEVPEPDNPWSNIGYWSDHQIIYLQKLLEIAEQVHPGAISRLWNWPVFAYADVPYRLRPYAQMLADWYNTIDFDWAAEEATETAVAQMGTDGRLLRDKNGQVIHATMTEKLLSLLLAKLANLVPEGGIWMNTQRPEWNDANNALVGKGLSVVTAAYLRRFIVFWLAKLANSETCFVVNKNLADLFHAIHTVFNRFQPHLTGGFSSQARRAMIDGLGTAVSNYRHTLYTQGIPGEQTEISATDLRAFLTLAQNYIEETLHANKRPDGLYHAYNVLHLDNNGTHIEHLYLMLEGQVAMLSSGLLTPEAALALLRTLRHSDLYRADQHTYMLYPYRRLPGFLQKNNIPAEKVASSQLAAALTEAGDGRLLVRDDDGVFHFNGRFRNANDTARVLDELAQEPAFAQLVNTERTFILNLFEETFNHRAFTGRSGTFFAYEGLGSIYWHMVSKLLLAAQEAYQLAVNQQADAATIRGLADAYYDIRAGLGFNKTPDVYGAFPTDPYSHTPWGSGARQPGMTGQVKEEILTRWGELGVSIQAGQLCFAPTLLQADELVPEPSEFAYVDAPTGQLQTLSLPPQSLAFTFCQTPVIYTPGNEQQIEVIWRNGRTQTITGCQLDKTISKHILDRDGQIQLVRVGIVIG